VWFAWANRWSLRSPCFCCWEDVQRQSDAQLTDITANGKGKLPAYKDKLTSEPIKQLVAFMRTLKKIGFRLQPLFAE
jgi:hypothetical protein